MRLRTLILCWVEGGLGPLLVPPSPRRTRRAGFPHRAPPSDTHAATFSDRLLERLGAWQLEPRATREIAPEQPMPLAASTQCSDPLELDFVKHPVQFPLAVVQGEVQIKSPHHRRQMRLLSPAVPVHMTPEPVMDAIQKLPTTVVCGNAHHGELAPPVHTAHVLEAQKYERAWLRSVHGGPIPVESPKQQQTGLLRL